APRPALRIRVRPNTSLPFARRWRISACCPNDACRDDRSGGSDVADRAGSAAGVIHLPASVRVYLCLTACDMRKSFDSLHALVRDHLELDAYAGHLFVFASRRRDQTRFSIPIRLRDCRVPLASPMSDYELSLLRQRGLAARDSKAQRGELKFAL